MRTSRKASKSRGFTYIELSVVVVVLALLAAIVMPRLTTVRESVASKLSLDAVQRLASRARELAISSGRPVTMAFNDADAIFELRQENEEAEGTVVSSAELHPDIEAQSFVAGASDVTAGDWQVVFYADGTSDGGSVEVSEGGILRTLVIGSKSGLSKWMEGAAPPNELERWQAGEYERRG